MSARWELCPCDSAQSSRPCGFTPGFQCMSKQHSAIYQISLQTTHMFHFISFFVQKPVPECLVPLTRSGGSMSRSFLSPSSSELTSLHLATRHAHGVQQHLQHLQHLQLLPTLLGVQPQPLLSPPSVSILPSPSPQQSEQLPWRATEGSSFPSAAR